MMPPDAAYALPANAESTRVSASAKPTRLVLPSTSTNGVTPRRSQAQNAKHPAISSSAATAKTTRF
jgi:hypothetical protein